MMAFGAPRLPRPVSGRGSALANMLLLPGDGWQGPGNVPVRAPGVGDDLAEDGLPGDLSGPTAPAADARISHHTPPAEVSSGRPDYASLLSGALGPRPELQGLRKVASILGPALMAASGNQGAASAMIDANNAPGREWDQQNREALLTAAKWGREDDLDRARREAPQYFSGNEDRVRFDPVTGQSSRVYDAPQDFEDYADAQGFGPGTPDYSRAVEDYVLRGNGPSAFKYDSDLETLRNAGRISLEGARQNNRVGLEVVRQGNRAALRGKPTYRDLHPGGRAERAATPSTELGAIYGKVRRGEALTAGEQQLLQYNKTRPGRGGAGLPIPSNAGNRPTVRTKQEYERLPSGTEYIAPNGAVMRKK
jgi:hypothetical protein